MKRILYILSYFAAINTMVAQQTPAAQANQSLLITGATLHLGDGTMIAEGATLTHIYYDAAARPELTGCRLEMFYASD